MTVLISIYLTHPGKAQVCQRPQALTYYQLMDGEEKDCVVWVVSTRAGYPRYLRLLEAPVRFWAQPFLFCILLTHSPPLGFE